MKRISVLLLAAALLAAAFGCTMRKSPQPTQRAGTPAGSPVTLEVFVPCGLASPFTKVREQFEAKNPSIRLKTRIENINVLVQRVLDGAAPDVFLALGDVEVERLRSAGRVEEASVSPLAGNYVGLIAPAGNPGQINSLEDLAGPAAGQMSLAQPEENSSGRHLRQALEKLGIWSKIQDRLVIARFPSDVQTMVAQAKVNVGAIYGPCFMEGSKKGGRPQPGQTKAKVTYLLTVPPVLAGACPVTALVCKGAVHRAQAFSLVEFMSAPQNRKAWEQWGFDPLPDSEKQPG